MQSANWFPRAFLDGATSTPVPGSGDAIVEQSILTSARAMEATLNVALVSLAWLRKMALDQAKEMKN